MGKRSKYKKIPEVEPKASQQEERVTTDFADDEEDLPAPSVGVDLEEHKLEFIDFFKGLFLTITAPLVTLAVSLGGESLALALGNPLVITLYPFIVVLLFFVGALPSLIGNFNSGYAVIYDAIGKFLAAYDTAMDLYVKKVVNPIKKVEKTIDKALEPMRPKLEKITKLETRIKKIDPHIELPDVTELEEKVESAEKEVVSKFTEIKEAVDVMGLISAPIRSKGNFNLYIVYPVLTVYLLTLISSIPRSGDIDTSQNITRHLRGTAEVVSTVDNDVAFDPPDDTQTHSVVVASFHRSLSTVLIVFIVTLKVLIQSFMKLMMEGVKSKLKEKLEEKLKPLKDKVAAITTAIKDQFKEIEEKIETIEKKMPFKL